MWFECRARLRPVAGLSTLTLDGLSRPNFLIIGIMFFQLADRVLGAKGALVVPGFPTSTYIGQGSTYGEG